MGAVVSQITGVWIVYSAVFQAQIKATTALDFHMMTSSNENIFRVTGPLRHR